MYFIGSADARCKSYKRIRVIYISLNELFFSIKLPMIHQCCTRLFACDICVRFQTLCVMDKLAFKMYLVLWWFHTGFRVYAACSDDDVRIELKALLTGNGFRV